MKITVKTRCNGTPIKSLITCIMCEKKGKNTETPRNLDQPKLTKTHKNGQENNRIKTNPVKETTTGQCYQYSVASSHR